MATRVPDDDAFHIMMKYCISFNIQGIRILFIQQETKVLDEKNGNDGFSMLFSRDSN